jgi:hypothetical protein
MSSLAAAAAERIARSAPDKTEYDHGSLRIRANTLVIDNAIYPIANISRISFSDLRTPVPPYTWIMLGVGVFCLLIPAARVFGVLMVLGAGYLLFQNLTGRADADYSLAVQMNSGNTALILGDDMDFLKAIALELYEVIELEKASNTTFNISQKVMIDSITGSPFSINGIHGDLVDHVGI